MNQVFKITVGSETIDGRLPARRVGHHFNCRFHIAGVPADTPEPPKVWVSSETGTLFWTGEWDNTIGVWVVDVNTDATETVGSYLYALTIYGEDEGAEYIAGQGAFTVYSTIASGGETGGTAGESLWVRMEALEARVVALEDRFVEFATLTMFDPLSAKDIEMREQVQTITNMLRGDA